MKKSLLALSAAALALSVSAAPSREQQKHHASSGLSFDHSVQLKGKSGLNLSAQARKAPARINTPEDIISSVEGTRQEVNANASGYAVTWWGLDVYYNRDFASHVVYGDNDEIYFYDIVPLIEADSYVKGVKKGDKIVIELPQTVAYSEEEEDVANICLLDYYYDDETGDEGFIPVEGSVELSVAEDGAISLEGLSEDHFLGAYYVGYEEWSGYGVWDLKLTKFDKEVVSVPEDLEVSPNVWNYKCEAFGYGWPLNFAQGEDLYFQGLSNMMPEAWVKATYEYGDSEAIVSIPQNQFVGIYNGQYVYTKAAQILVDEDYGWEYYELLPDDQPFELIWDYEEETMRVKDPNVSLLFNFILDDIDYLDEMYEFDLVMQDSYEGTPSDPTDLDYFDMMEDAGFSAFEFLLPGFSTEGDVLLTSDLSYEVYFNGEPFTFDPEVYYELEDPMTQVPWNYDGEDIMRWYGSCKHGFYFYDDSVATIGIQSVYKHNGEETRSGIVTYDLETGTVAVGTVDADKKVASVKYYGLDGREVTDPAAGIFVKRVVYDDGSVATFKKAIR